MITLTSLDLDAQLASAGPAAASFAALWQALWRQERLPSELLELCRLQLARLHQDAVEIAAVNPNLPRPLALYRRESVLAGRAHADPDFSAAEKAVFEFAEVYALDAQSITDELADRVKEHFGEPGLVLLIEALGCIDGRIRTARCLRDLAAAAPGRESAHGH